MSDLNEYYGALAQSCGYLFLSNEDTRTGELIAKTWTNIEFLEKERYDSYKHSNHYQPLHTDYGYFSIEVDISVLFCVAQATLGGSTFFISVGQLVEILSFHHPKLFEKLTALPVQFGRGEHPLSNNTDCVLSKVEGKWRINWNFYRVKDSNSEEVISMAADFKAFLEEQIVLGNLVSYIRLNPGEAVFFHDRAVLHGRCAFLGYRKLLKGALVTEQIEDKLSLLRGHLNPSRST
ncbi:MAG: TauD/TfdA family dioxygenase [Flavobacteriales bacterium]|nr:TauD/TfdA family dioxygenase [Flavobacteriales bacterium]